MKRDLKRDGIVSAVAEALIDHDVRQSPPELVLVMTLPPRRAEAALRRLKDIFMLRTDVEFRRTPEGVGVACIRDSGPIWAVLRVADEEGASAVSLFGPDEKYEWRIERVPRRLGALDSRYLVTVCARTEPCGRGKARRRGARVRARQNDCRWGGPGAA